jgi:hypothetical protein
LLCATAKVAQGAVREHDAASLPVLETHVRRICAWAGTAAGAGRQNSPAPAPATTGQASPSETRERIPDLLIRGHLKLTPEERRRIRQSIEQTNVEEQPIPRAFAPAAGMTAPPELTLTPLPQDLQQISGIGTQHRFARLKGGTILIVGEEGLVAAMIGSAER